MPTQIQKELFLCDYEHANGRSKLWAVLDELTLTYTVVVQAPDAASFALRRHVPSMREARVWAGGYRDRQSEAAGGPSDGERGRALRRATPEPRCRA